jgi:signal transduction histidine kinase/ActR/RegA family two-component response regulator
VLAGAVVIAAVLHLTQGWPLVWFWAAAYGAAQGLERALAGKLRAAGAESAGRLRAAAHGAQALAAATYGAITIPLWLYGGTAGAAAGTALTLGALLTLTATSTGSRRAFLAGAAPHLAYLLAQPLLAAGARLPAESVALVGLNAVMLLACVAMAWREFERGQRLGVLASAEADRRRAEAVAADAGKSAFIATVSHELRTPLSGILAAATELQRGAEDSRQAECAAIVADSARFMGGLLNDLLDLSKIDAGRMTVEQVDFDLGLFAHDVARFWAMEAGARRLPLRMDAALGLPGRVAGDPTRLRQVMNNLLSNALKFTGPDGVTWSIDASPLAGERWALEVRVRDTGPGIPADKLDRLFSPFDQTDASVARTHGGTGLGLAISRELARLMGGDLTVASAEGEGATFILTVVLQQAGAATAASAPTAALAPPSALRVLAADDHEINRRTLGLLLEPLGAEVSYAVNGQDALVRARVQAFDLILMDVNMPTMNGLEAVRRLRAEPGPNRRTPVAAVTGGDAPHELDACRAAGMTACVAKPLSAEALYSTIEACLAEDEAPRLARSA